MRNTASSRLSVLMGATAIVLGLAAAPALADSIFTKTNNVFQGRVGAQPVEGAGAIYPGDKAVIEGEGLVPGQQVTLMRGATVLNGDGPLVVDAEGKLTFELIVDEDAATGLQPIVVIAENPAAATVVDLKVSPEIPVGGVEQFDIASKKVTKGLYQVIYGEAADATFVTSAVGRPPVKESALVKIDPETLDIIGSVTPEAAPARADGSDGGLFAVYGVDVDDTNGNVWATNTRQDAIAVYKESDLSLVKQFAPGSVPHARDVVVDESRGRAYASATGTNLIKVFDTRTLEELAPITIPSQKRGEEFSTMALDLDEEAGIMVTASIATPEAALVDLNSGEVRVFALPGTTGAWGAAYDAQDKLLFVVSMATDNLMILNAETGEVLHDVPVGASPLNVTFEPTKRLAYIANRGSNTITVVDTQGKIVANLEAGSRPNQLRADGRGNVYAVNKSMGEEDATGDQIWRIRMKD
jgi:YVTN family beta-propeller protein